MLGSTALKGFYLVQRFPVGIVKARARTTPGCDEQDELVGAVSFLRGVLAARDVSELWTFKTE